MYDIGKLEAHVQRYLRERCDYVGLFSRFDRTPTCDVRTDGRKDADCRRKKNHSIYRTRLA